MTRTIPKHPKKWLRVDSPYPAIPLSCSVVDRSSGSGDLAAFHFKVYHHRTAADFAVVVDLPGSLCGRRQWHVKFFKAGWADDRSGFHGVRLINELRHAGIRGFQRISKQGRKSLVSRHFAPRFPALRPLQVLLKRVGLVTEE